MEKTEMYKAKIDDIIALCHILEDYREFIDGLNDLLYKPNLGRSISDNLSKVSHGVKLPFSARKVTKFYQVHKEVIDTINKYTDIGYFINNNYNWLGEPRKESGLDYFHEYIMNHLEKLDKILAVLKRLKQLGFREFKFEPKRDFTTEEQFMYTKFSDNFRFNYLDNIEVLPNYQEDKVKYKTTDSSYMIINGVITSTDELADYDREIILNSLTFDAKRLPKEITKEVVFDSIIKGKTDKKDLCQKIRSSVNLSITVDDLKEQYRQAEATIDSLLQMDDKKELYRILKGLKANIDELQNASTRYNQTITAKDDITLEDLEREKTLYLERQYWNNIDID